VSDAAIAQAQRWQRIRDLEVQIDHDEAVALDQDGFADQLEHIGHGKSVAMTKVFNAMGSVAAVQHRADAEKYYAEAVRLRDELAQIAGESGSRARGPAL
jgi:hypothetical protein